MLALLVISSCLSLTSAIVCPLNYCDHVTQPELNCTGSVISHAGFCGCYNICARVEGEGCSVLHIRGLPNTAICDSGLVCSVSTVDGVDGHRCAKAAEVLITSQPLNEVAPGEAKRQIYQCGTPCRRKSVNCAISMIIYQGQWFAKCDAEGNFLPEQCDNTGHCFCVNTTSGAVLEGTKVLGSADC